jgi:hypothetical protein
MTYQVIAGCTGAFVGLVIGFFCGGFFGEFENMGVGVWIAGTVFGGLFGAVTGVGIGAMMARNVRGKKSAGDSGKAEDSSMT